MMKHLGKALACAAAAAALVMAPLIAAPAMAEEEGAPPAQAQDAEMKVVVCKYVTTPGEGEVLQSGQNPIEVSVNALGDGFMGTFPYEFSDAQVRSIAIGWVGEGLSIADCPGYQPPQPEDEPLYETRDSSACTQPLDGTRTDVVEERSGTRTYVWDGDSWEPQDTWSDWTVKTSSVVPDELCAPAVVPLPALFGVAPQPPTCDQNGALPALVTLEHVTLTWDRAFSGPGTYVLTATAVDGFTFPDGTTVKTREFTVLAATGEQSDDPEAPCYRAEQTPPPGTETPPTPTVDTPTSGTPTGTAPITGASETGLAATGTDGVSPLLPIGGAALLAIGIAATALAALRRRA